MLERTIGTNGVGARLEHARVDAELPVRQGSTVPLAVDARRMQFFDPATGAVLGRRAAAAPAAG